MQLPSAFKEKYTILLGEESPDFFAALENQLEQKAFRINPLKNDIKLEDYIDFPLQSAPYSEWGYMGQIGGKTPLHQAGYVYSQEPSAMLVASIVDAKPGEKVLDLCAAPGGKSTQLASQLNGKGLLVSNEIVPKRSKILAENIERFGVTNCIVTNHAPAELVPHFTNFFDKIIVDAPCSGEGMFRRDEGAVDEWTIDTPKHCASRQKEILAHALTMLKCNGELIYSTCTFAPEENEEIISWLVSNYPLELLPINIENCSRGRQAWGNVDNLDYTVRLWPHLNQGEGHFIARLRFVGTHDIKPQKHKKTAKTLTNEQKQLVDALIKDFPIPFDYQLVCFGEQVWATPLDMPSIDKLRVLRYGLHLGTLLKKRFEPSFAFAMAISQQVKNYPHLPITYEQWKKYVNGETLTIDGNTGWVLLCYKDLVVGFGKHVQNTVKNFYPKGLRFQV